VGIQIRVPAQQIQICGFDPQHHKKKVRLTPVILTVQEAKIRRIVADSQPRQIVHETFSRKKTHHKKWLAK
jgi:hypothetical protein